MLLCISLLPVKAQYADALCTFLTSYKSSVVCEGKKLLMVLCDDDDDDDDDDDVFWNNNGVFVCVRVTVPTVKMPRMLVTSAYALQQLLKKTELMGLSATQVSCHADCLLLR